MCARKCPKRRFERISHRKSQSTRQIPTITDIHAQRYYTSSSTKQIFSELTDNNQSYHDLAVRMEPIILELEREENDLLIIAHESVLRVLYGYLMACNAADIPKLEFPRDEIIEVSSLLFLSPPTGNVRSLLVIELNPYRSFPLPTTTSPNVSRSPTCRKPLFPVAPRISRCLSRLPAL